MKLLDFLTPQFLGTPEPPPSPVARDLSNRLRTEPQTRRWFLSRGMSIGTIATLSLFPTFRAARAATTWFVDSAASGTGAGTSWTNAAVTVTAGLALVSAGDTILVNSTHSVSAGAAITWTPPAGQIAIISVTPSGGASYSAFTPGAQEVIGSAAGAFTVAGAAASSMYVNGMVIKASTNNAGTSIINLDTTTTSSNVSSLEMVSCTFDLPSASNATTILLGTSGGQAHSLRLKSCTFNCTGSRTGSYFSMQNGVVDIISPTFNFSGGSKPATLITGGTALIGNLTIRDGDASGFAGTAFVLLTSWYNTQLLMKNLKLNATPVLTNGSWPGGAGNITVRNCDSGNTDYTFVYADSFGTLTATTSIYKNSGASFNSEAVGWTIVTTAAANEAKPFATPIIQIWDTSTSAETPTISVAQATGATNLNDRTAWMTIEAAHSATTTQYDYVTGRNPQPFVGTGVDYAADTGATWTGVSSPNKQLLGLQSPGTITPARAGLLQARVWITTAGLTVYLNPQVGGIS